VKCENGRKRGSERKKREVMEEWNRLSGVGPAKLKEERLLEMFSVTVWSC